VKKAFLLACFLVPAYAWADRAPDISSVVMKDAVGVELVNGAVTSTGQVSFFWHVTNSGSFTTTFKVGASARPVTDLGGGDFTYVLNTAVYSESTLTLTITATGGGTTTVTRTLQIDRRAPILSTSYPVNCQVEKGSSSQTVTGRAQDTHLAEVKVVQTDSANPTGIELSTSWDASGNFIAPISLTNGTGKIVITAKDTLDHTSTRTVNYSYFPTGTSTYPYTVSVQTEDMKAVSGDFRINGQAITPPVIYQNLDGSTFHFEGLAQDKFVSFQTVLDPKYLYAYTVETGALVPTANGCTRTLRVIYPVVAELLNVNLLTKNSAGTLIPGVQYELDGKAVTIPTNPASLTIKVPDRVTFTVKVKYGVTQSLARIEGGIRTGETVTYNLTSGQLQRAMTPGTTRLDIRAEPIQVAVAEFDSRKAPITPAMRTLSALRAGTAQVASEHLGFGKTFQTKLYDSWDYEVSVHGGRTYELPSTNSTLRSFSFFYELIPVTLEAVDGVGTPLGARFQTLGTLDPIQGPFPASYSLGLGSESLVNVTLNGFSLARKAQVLEDQIVSIDLATGALSKTYSFLQPRVRWILDPIPVRFETVNSSGTPIAGTTGVRGAGNPSGASPFTTVLASETKGTAFSDVGGVTRDSVIKIQKGKLHLIRVSTGVVTVTPATGGNTIVRFQY